MSATPARIALALSDGVMLTRSDAAIRTLHPNAIDTGETEREMFFDTAADADVLLDELWNWRKLAGRLHEAVEVDSSLGLGTTVPVAPTVPYMTVIDEDRAINAQAKIRAFAVDYGTERYSVELLG